MKVDSIMPGAMDKGVELLRRLLFDTMLPKKYKRNFDTRDVGLAIEHIRGASAFIEREQAARFKRRSKANKKAKSDKITIDRKVVTDLASAVLFALKFSKMSGTRQQTDKGGKTVYVAWEETFMAALDAVGYSIDRKKFWADKSKRKGKR